MRRSLTLLATTLLLLTVSAAAASLTSNTTDSPSEEQLDCAKFDCFDNAVAVTGCKADNSTCICGSSLFTTNFTACATKPGTCNISTSSIPDTIAALGCPTANSPSTDQLDCAKFDCIDNAITATGCDAANGTCICGSSLFTTNFTACAIKTCNISTSDIQVSIATLLCPNGSAPATNTTSPNGSAPATMSPTSSAPASATNTTGTNDAARLKTASISVVGLILCALLI